MVGTGFVVTSGGVAAGVNVHSGGSELKIVTKTDITGIRKINEGKL